MAGKPDQRAILAQLAAMRAAGEISADEFQAAREKILGPQAAAVEPPTKARAGQAAARPAGGSKGLGCGTIVLIAIVGAIAIGAFSNATKSPQEKAQETAQAAEDKRKGFHCLSGWDGSHSGLIEAVKAQLRDPNSFELIETRITPVDSMQKHTVIMDFRSRNGFGGMTAGIATGTIDTSSCKLIGAPSIIE